MYAEYSLLFNQFTDAMTNRSPLSVVRHHHVATVCFERPPHNFVDVDLIRKLADVLRDLNDDSDCRAIVLAAGGKNFCAGANFAGDVGGMDVVKSGQFYEQAMRLFDVGKPIVAAVQGAAIGAGVGLALVADFRIASPSSRFSVNFNRLGIHPGFGLSDTLPSLIGGQKAALLFYTGRRIGGEEALAIGLADDLAPDGEILARAQSLAEEIATSAPLAVQSTRATMRHRLVDRVREANQGELAAQSMQFRTNDFQEGIKAANERRPPVFRGR